jgi:hypothetical protein
LKWILIAAGALVLLLAGALVALPWLVDVPRVQAYIATAASQALGRPVRFTSLSVTALPTPSVRLKGLQVAEDPKFGTQPFLVVEEGRFRLRIRPLLSGRVELTDLTLEKPRVEIIDDGTGRLNVASLGPAATPGRPAPRPPAGSAPAGAAAATISQVRLKDGVARVVRRGANALDLRLEDINVVVRPAGDTFALEGTGRLEPGGLKLTLSQTTLQLPPGRALGDAPLRATIAVKGADVAGLVKAFVATPALRGPVEGTLRVAGTISHPTAQGDLAFSGLTVSERRPSCPAPPERQLQLGEVRVPLAFTLARLDAAPLSARVAGGTVSARAALNLTAGAVSLNDVTVKGVELGPLLVDYLCQPYAVTGPLEHQGNVAFASGTPLTTAEGAGRLRIGPREGGGGGGAGPPSRRGGDCGRGRPAGRGEAAGRAHEAARLRVHHRHLPGQPRRDRHRRPALSGRGAHRKRGRHLRARRRAGGRLGHAHPGPHPGEGARDRRGSIRSRDPHRRHPGRARRGQAAPRAAPALKRAPPSLPCSTSPTKNA